MKMNCWNEKLRELFGIDIRSLALFRIGLAFVLLMDLFIRIQDLSIHYSDEGILPRSIVINHFLDDWHLSFHLMNGSWEVQLFLFILEVLFAISLLIGFHTRLSIVLSWLFLISLQTRNPLINHGGDTVLRMLLFWGMFLPLGSFWSVDQWLKKSKTSQYQVVSASTVALLLQICSIYWFTAILKTDAAWRQDGTAVWYVFSNEIFAKSLGRFLLHFPSLLQMMTFSTLFLEFLGPFFAFSPIWTAPLRFATAIVFMFFHLALSLTLELGIFSHVCTVAWMVFLPSLFWETVLSSTRLHVYLALPRYLIGCGNPLPEDESKKYSKSSLKQIPTKPWKQHWLFKYTAIFFLIYIVLWNLRSVNVLSFPAQFNAIGSLIRVDQYWNMFAPFPLREDGWFLIPAKLRNGKEVDLYTGKTPVNWEHPQLCSACFKNDRWRSFMLNLVFDERNAVSLSTYAGYLLKQWNDNHPYEENLIEFEIIFMSKKNSWEMPPQISEKFVLWKELL